MYQAITTPRSQPVVTPEQLASFGRFDLPQQYVYGSTTQLTDDYQMLLTFIEAATDEIEDMAAQACLQESIVETYDYFPGQSDPRQEMLALNYAYLSIWWWYGFPTLDSIELVRRPVLSTPAPVVTYYDTTGTLQTLDPTLYTVKYNKICLNVGQTWPITDRRQDCIQINYSAGYSATDPTQVPARLIMAILYLANHFYNVRQVISVETTTEVGMTLTRMLRTFRSMRIPH
jgi:uncharacterized phiE125 gp8 family phage protein